MGWWCSTREAAEQLQMFTKLPQHPWQDNATDDPDGHSGSKKAPHFERHKWTERCNVTLEACYIDEKHKICCCLC